MVSSLALTSVAYASDAVGPGTIKNLTFRGNYLMFQLIDGTGVNSCALCPGDPGSFASGGYCWMTTTNNATQVSLLELAKAQGVSVSGRVTALSTDCTVYQMSLADQ